MREGLNFRNSSEAVVNWRSVAGRSQGGDCTFFLRQISPVLADLHFHVRPQLQYQQIILSARISLLLFSECVYQNHHQAKNTLISDSSLSLTEPIERFRSLISFCSLQAVILRLALRDGPSLTRRGTSRLSRLDSKWRCAASSSNLSWEHACSRGTCALLVCTNCARNAVCFCKQFKMPK